jgi:hypothetical protein
MGVRVMRMRVWLAAGAAIGFGLLAAGEAQAGTYVVVSCTSAPSGVNNAWQFEQGPVGTGSGIWKSVQACPAQDAETAKGLAIELQGNAGFARARSDPPPPASGLPARNGSTWARHYVISPPNTTIAQLSGSFWCHMPAVNPNVWGLHSGPTAGGATGVTCNGTGFTAKTFTPPAGTQWIEYFVECQSNLASCKAQSSPRLALSRSELTISDPQAPAAQPTGGDLSLGWTNNSAELTFAASDNTGIHEARLRIDGAIVASSTYPCDYTRVVPCANVSGGTLTANVSALSDAVGHTWSLEVVDAAGNATQSPVQSFWVDRTPPGTAADLTATYDPDTAESDLSWDTARDPGAAPGGVGSGTDTYTYRYRRDGGAWSGWAQTQASHATLSGSHDGEQIDAEIRATDLAGNAGGLYAASDVAAPSNLTVESFGDPTPGDHDDIDFSDADEPQDGDAPAFAPAFPARAAAPATAAAAYHEDNCSGASPCGTYDRLAAADYASYWWSRRNGDYASYGNDCTNFVSQALKHGGMRFMRTHGFNDPTPATKDYIDNYDQGSGAWWMARIPSGIWGWDWRFAPSFTQSQASHDRLLDRAIGRHLLSPERPRAGDVVYYKLKGPDHGYTHAAFVTKVTRKKVVVVQHTTDYEDIFANVADRLDRKLGKGNWTFVFIRPTHNAYDIDD